MNRNPGRLRLLYPIAGDAVACRIAESGGKFTFQPDGGDVGGFRQPFELQIESSQTGAGLCRSESGRIHSFAWGWVGLRLHLWLDGDLFIFQREEGRRQGSSPGAEAPGDVLAPMPGAVLEVLVAEGERVERNQTVLVMESMKMELAITAPVNAVVQRIAVQPGQQVERGMRLLELAPEG